MRLIDADTLIEMGATCFARRNENGQLEAIMAIDFIPTVELQFARMVNGIIIPIKIQQREWIPVSERLPEEMQDVLIWFEYRRSYPDKARLLNRDFHLMNQTYGFGYVCDGKWSPFINGETGWTDYNVIAWQPLPEPYKKGEKE